VIRDRPWPIKRFTITVRDSINKFEIARKYRIAPVLFELNNRLNDIAAFEKNEQAIKQK